MKQKPDFEDYFQRHIWARGEAISISDAIDIHHRDAECIQATVEGTEDYEVHIQLDGDRITDMSCTCPYAASGENCKHMAAVLIESFGHGDEEGEDRSVNLFHECELISQAAAQKEQLEKLIKSVSFVELTDFLSSEMLKNTEFKKNFITRFAPEHVSVKEMIGDFESICYHYLGRERFINYYRAHEFFNELDCYLERIRVLMKTGQSIEVALIISEITKGFDELPLDDSDGGTTDFYTQIIDMVEELISYKEEGTTRVLSDWMSRVVKDPAAWYLSELIYPLWSAQFSEEELIEREISMLKERLQLSKSTAQTAMTQVNDYQFVSKLIQLADLMRKRGDEEKTIQAMLDPFRNSDQVLKWLIDSARQKGRQEEEYTLILEGIELGKTSRMLGIQKGFELNLCRFYQRTGQHVDYLRMLKDLVLEDTYSLELYNEYKNWFTLQEWIAERDDIIHAFETMRYKPRVLFEIYSVEKKYDCLVKLVEKQGNLSILNEYSKVLLKQYPAQVLQMYLSCLDSEAARQGNKGHYQQVVQLMKRIQRLPGGDAAIAEKAKEYALLYKRRPTFLVELNKVKWEKLEEIHEKNTECS